MKEKPGVLVTKPMFHVGLDEFRDFCTPHALWESERPDELLRQVAPTCRAVALRDVFTAQMMEQLPQLGLISVCGVGYDDVDVQAALDRGIQVTHTPGVLTEDVADLAVGLVLAAGRRIVQGDQYVRSGRWSAEGLMPYTRRVHGKRMGILGLGRIGLAIARRCEAFNMEIAYHNRNRRDDVNYSYRETLKELAAWADYLVVAMPGGTDTHHIVNAGVLQELGPDGVLVNVGRGSNVDTQALILALEKGTLGCAALDVVENEPAVPGALLSIKENLILQPHHASATFETRRAMVELTFDNIRSFLEGRPLISLIPECRE